MWPFWGERVNVSAFFAGSLAVSWEEWWTYDGISGQNNSAMYLVKWLGWFAGQVGGLQRDAVFVSAPFAMS